MCIRDRPNSYFWLPIIPFESDDRLLITAPGHFRTYALNHENKLVETGRLEVPLSEWGRYWIDTHSPSFYRQDMNTRTAFDGAHLLAGNSRDNVAYVIDVTADGTFGATVNNEPTEGMCDYTNADIYDGWGWNAATGQSCAPEQLQQPQQPQQPQQEEQNSGCDYSQADNYGGWGWSSTTLMSCPPITTTSASCEDTAPVGDGWGWDGVASCRVVSDTSIPSSNTECVDTIPIGDGWGWDGSASCRVDSVSN